MSNNISGRPLPHTLTPSPPGLATFRFVFSLAARIVLEDSSQRRSMGRPLDPAEIQGDVSYTPRSCPWLQTLPLGPGLPIAVIEAPFESALYIQAVMLSWFDLAAWLDGLPPAIAVPPMAIVLYDDVATHWSKWKRVQLAAAEHAVMDHRVPATERASEHRDGDGDSGATAAAAALPHGTVSDKLRYLQACYVRQHIQLFRCRGAAGSAARAGEGGEGDMLVIRCGVPAAKPPCKGVWKSAILPVLAPLATICTRLHAVKTKTSSPAAVSPHTPDIPSHSLALVAESSESHAHVVLATTLLSWHPMRDWSADCTPASAAGVPGEVKPHDGQPHRRRLRRLCRMFEGACSPADGKDASQPMAAMADALGLRESDCARGAAPGKAEIRQALAELQAQVVGATLARWEQQEIVAFAAGLPGDSERNPMDAL